MQKQTAEDFVRRYFLGDLSEEDRLRAEDEYLADARVFEQFVATENDLIDRYVRGELSEADKQKFDTEYLTTPERVEKLQFARALKQVCELEAAAYSTETFSPWQKILGVLSSSAHMPRWVLAAATLMIVASGLWLVRRDVRLRGDLHQALANQADLRREDDGLRQHIVELQKGRESKSQQNQTGTEVASLEPAREKDIRLRLIPGITRGPTSQQNSVALRPRDAGLQLQLLQDQPEYHTYEAVLLTADGKEVLRATALRGHVVDGVTIVAWRLPPRAIGAGDYVVRLKGRTDDGHLEVANSYSFRILP